MAHAKHRKPSTRERYPFRTWLTASVFVLLGMGVAVACAAPAAPAAETQQAPASTEWKSMAVSGLEYACDPTLGIIVRHTGTQTGASSSESYKTWTISVTSYAQLSTSQMEAMCG